VIRRDAPAQRGLTDINTRKAPTGRFFIAGYEGFFPLLISLSERLEPAAVKSLQGPL
jgi:hypothetical protein